MWRLLLLLLLLLDNEIAVASASCSQLFHLHLLHYRSVRHKHLLVHKCGLLQLLQLVGIDLEIGELWVVLHVHELTHGQLLLVLVELRHVLHEELLLLELLLRELNATCRDWVHVLLLVEEITLLDFLAREQRLYCLVLLSLF